MVLKLRDLFGGNSDKKMKRLEVVNPPATIAESGLEEANLSELQTYPNTPPPIPYETLAPAVQTAKKQGQTREIGKGGMGYVSEMPAIVRNSPVFQKLLGDESDKKIAIKSLFAPSRSDLTESFAIESGINYECARVRADLFSVPMAVVLDDTSPLDTTLRCRHIIMELLRGQNLEKLLDYKDTTDAQINAPDEIKDANEVAAIAAFLDVALQVEDQNKIPTVEIVEKKMADMSEEEVRDYLRLIDSEIIEQQRKKIDYQRYILKKPLSLAAVLNLAIQIADALRVVHEPLTDQKRAIDKPRYAFGDLKASNVFIDLTGQAKLLDFGMARHPGKMLPLEKPDLLVGTIEYLAPEIFVGGRINIQSDLYELGVLLYKLLTNELPFDDDIKPGAKLAEKYPRIKRPDSPKELNELVYELLRANPQERPASTQSVLDRLHEICDKYGEIVWPIPSTVEIVKRKFLEICSNAWNGIKKIGPSILTKSP